MKRSFEESSLVRPSSDRQWTPSSTGKEPEHKDGHQSDGKVIPLNMGDNSESKVPV
jgi:hypothetical protein